MYFPPNVQGEYDFRKKRFETIKQAYGAKPMGNQYLSYEQIADLMLHPFGLNLKGGRFSKNHYVYEFDDKKMLYDLHHFIISDMNTFCEKEEYVEILNDNKPYLSKEIWQTYKDEVQLSGYWDVEETQENYIQKIDCENIIKESSYKEKENIAKTTDNIEFLKILAKDNDMTIKMLIASNPNIDRNIINLLFEDNRSFNSVLFNAVVKNDNIPFSTKISLFYRLAEKYDNKQNLFETVSDEYTTLLKNAPENALKFLLEDISFVIDEDLRYRFIDALLQNPNCDLDFINYMCKFYRNTVKECISRDNFENKEEYYNFLIKNNFVTDIIMEIYDNKDLSENELKKFAELNSSKIALGILEHPNCTVKLEEILIKHENCEINKLMSKFTKQEEIIEKCVRDPNEKVRILLAQNSHLPMDVMVQLSTDNSEKVRESLAKNLKISPIILGKLTYDESSIVQCAALSNPNRKFVVVSSPNATKEILKSYTMSDDVEVLMALVQNPNCDSNVLSGIIKNPILQDKNKSMQFKKILSDLKENINNKYKDDFIKEMPISIIVKLLENNDININLDKYIDYNKEKAMYLSLVENNIEIPEKLLDKFIEDKNFDIVYTMLSNVKMEPEKFEELIDKYTEKNEMRFIEALLHNENMPAECVEKILIKSNIERDNPVRRHGNVYFERDEEYLEFLEIISSNSNINSMKRRLFYDIQNANEFEKRAVDKHLICSYIEQILTNLINNPEMTTADLIKLQSIMDDTRHHSYDYNKFKSTIFKKIHILNYSMEMEPEKIQENKMSKEEMIDIANTAKHYSEFLKVATEYKKITNEDIYEKLPNYNLIKKILLNEELKEEDLNALISISKNDLKNSIIEYYSLNKSIDTILNFENDLSLNNLIKSKQNKEKVINFPEKKALAR